MKTDPDFSGPASFSIEEINSGDTFRFSCDASQPCFNRCCSEAVIPLTPYDVLRLRHNLNMSSEEFLQAFAAKNVMEDTGLPLPMLRMLNGPEAPCPFVTPGGCSLYEDRPGVCRAYPLSLAANLENSEESAKYFLVKEEGCHGHCCGPAWTPEEWLKNEDMEKYNSFNRDYISLARQMRQNGKKADPRMANLFFLSLYQIDRFRDFITKMNLFSRIPADISEQGKIMAKSLEGDEACLNFSVRWLQFLINEMPCSR